METKKFKLNTITSLNAETIDKIESFLENNNSIFTSLYSSPLWAERLKSLIGFKYKFLVIEDEKNIKALHLIFEGFRGYTKINNLPNPFKSLAIIYAKKFYSYVRWYNFIIFENKLEEKQIIEVKTMIYKYINRYTNIQNSPIYNGDEKYFLKTQTMNIWGTYILDITDCDYEEVYASFKRQARRPIKKAKEQGIIVKILQKNDIEKYAQWQEDNQKETGKNYKVDIEKMEEEFFIFKKRNYIYEIFVAYENDIILGSLGIWGYNNFIAEWGVYQSQYAKKKKLYIQDLIKDNIIIYMLDNNIKYYDLAGFNPSENATHKEKSIQQFKSKFNGNELIYKTVKG